MKTKHLSIMFTDIKGFTSKTANKSRKELHRMLELHDALIKPIFKEFGGKIIKTIGDAFLVTFASPTEAVLCGMKIQKVLAKHNEYNEHGDILEVRVAINCGEVTLKGRDIFGDPVNIAARLEGVAEAGDVYFTEAVYLSMNKSEIPTADIGHRHFKGIPEDIKVYKVLKEGFKGKIEKRKSVLGIGKLPIPDKIWVYTKKLFKWAAIIVFILFIIGLIVGDDEEEEYYEEELYLDGLSFETALWPPVDESADQMEMMQEAVALEYEYIYAYACEGVSIATTPDGGPDIDQELVEYQDEAYDVLTVHCDDGYDEVYFFHVYFDI